MNPNELRLLQLVRELKRNTGTADSVLIGSKIPVSDRGFSAGRPDLTAMPDAPSLPPRSLSQAAALDTYTAAADMANAAMSKGTGKLITRVGGTGARRMAGSAARALKSIPGIGTAGRVLPGLASLGAVLGAADILAGDDSLGNKVMDAGAMTIGGILGAAGGPMGIAAGAGIGKSISDGAQYVFGGGKSQKEREMEELIRLLQG